MPRTIPLRAIWIAAFSAIVALALLTSSLAWADPGRWKREWGKTDFSKTTVDFSEIISGGPPKDGIPSIDNPKFLPAAKVDTLGENEPVIRFEINGELRGYPLQVLTWHEIVNDTVGGVPVAVTYCPLCNSAIVFERVVDGEPTTFGTTGKLRNSDMVMYDRATESWWQQFTGEGIVGVQTGTQLKMLPARVVSFSEFKSEAPDAPVLVPNNARVRRYGQNPYAGYDSAPVPFLYRGSMPEGIEPMVRVVVVRDGELKPIAISLPLLREKGEMNLDGITLEWRDGVNSALDRATIADGRDVGSVRTYRTGTDGQKQDLVHDITFAFAFHAFHPDQPIKTQ